MNKFSIILFFVIFSGCSTCDLNPTKSIDRLQTDYKKNGYYKNIKSNNFKHIRQVINDESGLEISYMADETTLPCDVQKVLVVKKDKKAYTIPFFSNSFREYWNFENESLNTKSPKTGLTIGDELENCISHLELNTTANDWILLEEIFKHVLNCRVVRNRDTIDLPMCAKSTNVRILGEDNLQENNEKNKKHLESIKASMQDGASSFYYDEDNCRLYELRFLNYNWHNNPCLFEIKTYRYEYLHLELKM